jgi:hypothetical protein
MSEIGTAHMPNRLDDLPAKIVVNWGEYCQYIGIEQGGYYATLQPFIPKSCEPVLYPHRFRGGPCLTGFKEELEKIRPILNKPNHSEREDLEYAANYISIPKYAAGGRTAIGTLREHAYGYPIYTHRHYRRVFSADPEKTPGCKGAGGINPATLWWVTGGQRHVILGRGVTSPETWGINFDNKWGIVKRQIKNMYQVLKFLQIYPWPAPQEYFSHLFIIGTGNSRIKELVLSGKKLTTDGINIVITLEILDKFETLANSVNASLEDYAERKKRSARVRAIAGGIAVLAFSFVAPVALAAGFTAIQTAVDARSQVKIARSMVDAAKQFEVSDAAFAANIKSVAKLIEAKAAKQAEQEAKEKADFEALIDEEGAYEVIIEGKSVGVADNPEEAGKLAESKASTGERFTINFKGSPVASFVKGVNKSIPVHPEQKISTDAMTKEELYAFVENVEGVKIPFTSKYKIPWWIVGPAAAVIAVKMA